MGGRKNISLVKVPLGGDKTLYELGLTLVHPYFGEKKRFVYMYDNYWSKYPQNIKDKLHIVLVDDCGTPAIHTLMSGRKCDFNLTIFRITDNLKYNTAGALNVGSVEASTDFILQMDSDCVLDLEMMGKLMQTDPMLNWMYKFRRKRITDDPNLRRTDRYLPCANLLHKDVFKAVHGFDEDFTGARSGGYGYFDNHFDHKVLAQKFRRAVIDGIIVTEYMESLVEPGESTGPLGVGVHRTARHNEINRSLYRRKCNGLVPENHSILRFKYEKVYEHTI